MRRQASRSCKSELEEMHPATSGFGARPDWSAPVKEEAQSTLPTRQMITIVRTAGIDTPGQRKIAPLVRCGAVREYPPRLGQTRGVAPGASAARVLALPPLDGPASTVRLHAFALDVPMSSRPESRRPHADRGRLMNAMQVATIVFNGGRSAQWVRRTVAPEKKVRLGHSTLLWWECDVLEWIDRQSSSK